MLKFGNKAISKLYLGDTVYAKEDGKYVLDLYPCLDTNGVACMHNKVLNNTIITKEQEHLQQNNRR